MPNDPPARATRDGSYEGGRGELIDFPGGSAAVFTASSPGGDEPNEDACAFIPFDAKRGVLAVADGVGGLPGGAQASQVAMSELARSISEAARQGGELRDAILNGFETAHRKVVEAGSGSATTLVVAEIQERQLRPYHTGDSGILVVGQRGKVKLQTIPQSPIGYAVESGFLDEREALHHDQRHEISAAIGLPEMRIEIGSALALARRDTLLLASDGLFDNLHVDEIVKIIRAGPLAGVMGQLVASCWRRMSEPRRGEPSKPDDLTFIVFRPNA